MEPVAFAAWMRILKQVPGSVLWMLHFPAAAMPFLKREAEAAGVDASRLVFSPLHAKAGYMRRAQVADLFLDTPACNAHTTVQPASGVLRTFLSLLFRSPSAQRRWANAAPQGTDVLWAGVPIVTCPGETMASRICASLVTAMGLTELVVRYRGDGATLVFRTYSGLTRSLRPACTQLYGGVRGTGSSTGQGHTTLEGAAGSYASCPHRAAAVRHTALVQGLRTPHPCNRS